MNIAPTLLALSLISLLATGCLTRYQARKYRMPQTESERAQVDFLARNYELEGHAPPQAQALAIREWNRSVNETEEEDDGVRIFPETGRDEREVDRLAEKYEEKGYNPTEARLRALDAWRRTIRIKIR